MVCTVDPDTGDETCRSVKKTPQQKKRELAPSDIPLQCGGLMVLPKGESECIDYSSDCRTKVMDDPEGCDEDDDELFKCCKASCSICKETELVQTRGNIGIIQRNDGTASERQGVDDVITEMTRYLSDEVLVEDSYRLMYQECTNKNELCAFWASVGECQANKGYMTGNCMLACKLCNEHSKYLHTMKVGG